ncbi:MULTISPECIES: glycosyltransferase family 2 protein [Megasphaera]|uniref:Putative bactoprenol glucosyl transferase-like protein n=1 Tax=Megasphaera hutchinsoni TaxID=1588748 RepID=A0A134CFE4_9FIRM|nr:MULTISPECIES: glycosyltransferase family 2 protein [Megasphaera]EGS35620.1 putative bactoprenol glucosyl transferase-like protein [Megasphaera sp. UPII 135-E]KXB90824.1 putative bactoprenol glucosyl transferase-like protein [Megasphaera hutchinsoni]MUP48598.1 glycosyltransferase [Veillonellaceae bacterium M2-8]
MNVFKKNEKKMLSIVVPVYNEQLNIEKFYTEVIKNVATLDMAFEIIFVDDGSSDTTPLLLSRLTKQDLHVRALILARNFGHQLAITCGMDHARGDAIITMDGDLQHPPEMIPDLVQKWREGYDVVQTVRESTDDVGILKRLTSKWYYILLNALSPVHITPGGSDFRLIDRRVLETFSLFREHDRFIRGMIGDIGYRQIKVNFVAPKRFAGKSKFSVRKMIHFALDGITAYSKIPLRLALYTGLISGMISILIILHVLYCKIAGEAIPGWATSMVVVCLIGGLQLIFLGIIGEYIGRIFQEVKNRPLYWVRAELGEKEE